MHTNDPRTHLKALRERRDTGYKSAILYSFSLYPTDRKRKGKRSTQTNNSSDTKRKERAFQRRRTLPEDRKYCAKEMTNSFAGVSFTVLGAFTMMLER